MNVLAVDTALGKCSVAIWNNGQVLAYKKEEAQSRQAEMLVPLIEEALKESELTYKNINLLATTVGPGSFTGLRIGISAIKSISLVTEIPAIGITTLESISKQANNLTNHNNDLLITLNAMRGQLYIQKFSKTGQPANQPSLINNYKICEIITDNLLIAGNCNKIITDICNEKKIDLIKNEILPDAISTAELAYEKYTNQKEHQSIKPLYIRTPDAKLPKNKSK